MPNTAYAYGFPLRLTVRSTVFTFIVFILQYRFIIESPIKSSLISNQLPVGPGSHIESIDYLLSFRIPISVLMKRVSCLISVITFESLRYAAGCFM